MRSLKLFVENASPNRHQRLNPKLWDGDVLRPEVKTSLLKFAKAWQDFAKIPDHLVQDIFFLGGNASHYYNDKSDIDVHLLIDRSKLGQRALVDDYLQDRKTLWSLKHHAMVKGYPLEPYAQDLSEHFVAGQGVYSLKFDHWVQRPAEVDYDPSTDHHLDPKIEHWKRVIDKAISEKRSDEEFERLKDKLRNLRSVGLKKGGELSPENMIYKALRNEGYLDKMTDYLGTRQDKSLSLE